MTTITIRTIDYKGQHIAVTADSTGLAFVGAQQTNIVRDAQKLLPAGKVAFLWASEKAGLPPHTKIALTQAELNAYDAHCAAHVAAMKAKYAAEAKTGWTGYYNGTSFGMEDRADIAASRSRR
jgi:hypothetical protein